MTPSFPSRLRGTAGILTSFLALLAGCGESEPLPEPTPDEIAPAPAPESDAPEAPAALTGEQIGFMSLQLPQFGGDITRFREGQFEDPENRRFATILPGPRATSDFDGDGSPEMALVVAANSGGTGMYMNLLAVGLTGNRPAQEAILDLGDRVQVRRMRVDGLFLIVDTIEQGPDDPMCCPSTPVTTRYRLTNGEWVAVDR